MRTTLNTTSGGESLQVSVDIQLAVNVLTFVQNSKRKQTKCTVELNMDWNEKWSDNRQKKSPKTKTKCKFCEAVFTDDVLRLMHAENCMVRLSAFLASDGRIKFACMVSSDSSLDCKMILMMKSIPITEGMPRCVL